MSCIKTGFEGL